MLRLAGPLQSWGDGSRFQYRNSRRAPTKSGVLGLLAAAQGRRRTDSIEDLLNLRFGVRVDQPGVVMTDYQTAHTRGPDKAPVVSYRQYLADAAFVAGVEAEPTVVETLAAAVRRPRFPLFLGRRSCPLSGRLFLGVRDGDLESGLADEGWVAAEWHRRRQPRRVDLPFYFDSPQGRESVRDNPVSFSPARRQYEWRTVANSHVTKENPDGRPDRDGDGLVDWLGGLEDG
ncbi:type I-E CRISPR-associated protein Cas5/CasD [Enemella evansiae]|nr:type I-E CRISPR-associated protein Cas5/CasD [Enemella evansiae]